MSKNLKALLEKRNGLVAEMETAVGLVETEERAFDDAELSKMEKIKKDIGSIDSSINMIKETRSFATAEEATNFGEGENNLTEKLTNEQETRGLEQFLRGREGTERRALEDATTLSNDVEATAGNGGVTVPTSVHTEIIEKLREESPIFAAVRKFGSVTGNLKVAREDALHDEGFIGETLDASKIKPTLKTVTLTQKRVGAAIQLTNQLINDSGVDIVGYSNSLLSRSVSRAIERGILLGAKDPENANETFRPIIGDPDVQNMELAGADGPTVEEILSVYSMLNPGYLDGAMFIVSRKVFNFMLKLKDGDGTYLVFRDLVQGKPGYTLFGIPVHVTHVLTDAPDGKELVLGNFSQAYGMLVKGNMSLTVVTADTTQALAGGRLAVLDAYMDGAIINPDAVVTASITTP